MKKYFWFILLLALSATTTAQKNIIFETDMGNDVDDALAIDMLYKYHSSGRINLMAIMLTLANGSGSYILSAGQKKRAVKDGFKRNEEGFVSGLVSRKKQLLPGIISTLGAK